MSLTLGDDAFLNVHVYMYVLGRLRVPQALPGRSSWGGHVERAHRQLAQARIANKHSFYFRYCLAAMAGQSPKSLSLSRAKCGRVVVVLTHVLVIVLSPILSEQIQQSVKCTMSDTHGAYNVESSRNMIRGQKGHSMTIDLNSN